MRFDTLFKFQPLALALQKLPGIGPVYASRLRNYNINTFGDFVSFYQKSCKCNADKFHDELKEMAAMKIDSIRKVVDLIRTYLIQVN